MRALIFAYIPSVTDSHDSTASICHETQNYVNWVQYLKTMWNEWNASKLCEMPQNYLIWLKFQNYLIWLKTTWYDSPVSADRDLNNNTIQFSRNFPCNTIHLAAFQCQLFQNLVKWELMKNVQRKRAINIYIRNNMEGNYFVILPLFLIKLNRLATTYFIDKMGSGFP